MSGSCPYCGAKLNYGIKFCVVCGRPIQAGETTKMGGGMRAGIRPADVTRRLEDLMTAARFKRSKRQVNLDQSVHFFSLKAFSIVTGIALLFCAVKLSIDGGFINKNQQMVAPINKILTDIGANKVNFKDMKPTTGGAKGTAKSGNQTSTTSKKSKTKRKQNRSHREQQ
ncbi:MAG: hypothetical protein IPP97_22140 [Candidatus Obscuribacter sp.]|jgi:hypothetical protein|nr:hypothetical protein [Candidatus Obscuribacter sp.]MBL0188431.1 hypothetical protein [Candidatus Obscuribacter sp.]MBP6349284.1 hypothetical protein [Candidatus Obscuribacter sp.]MBP6591687.1 hypothetical protein [Candidatus Obscuribacter sp.]MBP7576296.1 hypothetical protein [Candidatus Obscuribacter sp.]